MNAGKKSSAKSARDNAYAQRYASARASEQAVFYKLRAVAVVLALLLLSLLATVVLFYTPVGDGIVNQSRTARVTVHSASGQLQHVEIERSSSMDEHRNYESKSISIINDVQFDINVDDLARGDSVRITVTGEGEVSCRVVIDNILIAERNKLKEVTCQAMW